MIRRIFFSLLLLALSWMQPLAVFACSATTADRDPIWISMQACLRSPAHKSDYGTHTCQMAAIRSYVYAENAVFRIIARSRHGRERLLLVQGEKRWRDYIDAQGDVYHLIAPKGRGASLYLDKGVAVVSMLILHIQELKELAESSPAAVKGPATRSGVPFAEH